MRKIFVVAAFVACVAVPGMASANFFVSAPVEMAQGGIDQVLLESILRQVGEQTSYEYGCLCGMYEAGEIVIGKNQNGQYVISIQLDGGGLAEIILDDSF